MLQMLGCHETSIGVEGFFMLAKTAGMAAVPAGVFILGWIRKARHDKLVENRVARGECPGCGYPLGVQDRCTECGAYVDRGRA